MDPVKSVRDFDRASPRERAGKIAVSRSERLRKAISGWRRFPYNWTRASNLFQKDETRILLAAICEIGTWLPGALSTAIRWSKTHRRPVVPVLQQEVRNRLRALKTSPRTEFFRQRVAPAHCIETASVSLSYVRSNMHRHPLLPGFRGHSFLRRQRSELLLNSDLRIP